MYTLTTYSRIQSRGWGNSLMILSPPCSGPEYRSARFEILARDMGFSRILARNMGFSRILAQKSGFKPILLLPGYWGRPKGFQPSMRDQHFGEFPPPPLL